MLRVAREIAMDLHPIETILENHNLSVTDWEVIQRNPVFQRYLEGAVADWNSAINTHERVKLKAAALVEEWLPELNARIHDRAENLNHKIEGAKLAARLADMGLGRADVAGTTGERFSVVINLGGSDNTMRIEKELPVIEHEDAPSG